MAGASRGNKDWWPVAHGGKSGDTTAARCCPIPSRRQPVGPCSSQVTCAPSWFGAAERGFVARARLCQRGARTLCVSRVPVHRDVGDIESKHFRRPGRVLFSNVNSSGRLVNKIWCGSLLLRKVGCFSRFSTKCNIRGNAPNAEFAQGAVHAGRCLLCGVALGGEL